MHFVDLQSQFKELEQDIRSRIDTVLAHGKFIMGPEVYEFEEQLADFVGVKHAISCSSGTDALLMPLMALGIGQGDAVFTTTFSFIATAEVISLLGATPVFVDIDPKTFNIDPKQLNLAINAIRENSPSLYPIPHNNKTKPLKPKAIITVDLFGLPADYDSISHIANKENLYLLEDAAQGLGGVYKGKNSGSFGLMGATSFFPAKPLGCYGDGGAVLTDEDELAHIVKSLRTHGKGSEKYENVRIGLNARMDTLQAAILLPKLAVFRQELQSRQHIADEYTSLLDQASENIHTPFIPEGYSSAWAQYSILTYQRDKLQQRLKDSGIPSMVYYKKGLHQQKAYADLQYKKDDFPITQQISDKILSLPMHPYLQKDDLKRTTDTLVSCQV